MARFHFDIQENDRFMPDEVGSDFEDEERVRQLALATGASIARDAFVEGAIPAGPRSAPAGCRPGRSPR
jgi:hypothetical protein